MPNYRFTSLGRDYFSSLAPRNLGIVLALTGIILFSTKAILIKLAYAYQISTVELMTLRMGFSLPIYLLVGFIAWPRNAFTAKINAGQYLGIGLTGVAGYYLASYLDLQSLHHVSVSLERMVLFSYPVFVLILTALLYRKPLLGYEVGALAIAYCGIAISVAGDGFNSAELGPVLIGSVYALGAAFSFAIFLIGSQYYSRQIGSTLFTTIAMIAASLAILSHFALTRQLVDLVFPLELYVITLIMAVFSTVLPSYLISSAVKRIGANTTGILGACGPISAALMAVLVLDETFSVFHALGMTLVIAGVWMVSRGSSKPPAVPETA